MRVISHFNRTKNNNKEARQKGTGNPAKGAGYLFDRKFKANSILLFFGVLSVKSWLLR